MDFVDVGLGETVGIQENGKFKVPSLRNIAKTAPYMHNGVFSDLKQVVDFYNTRDVDDKWEAPEVADNVNKDELGDLGLTDEEVDAIIAFLRTLTDDYQFQEKPTYAAENGIIEIPYIRTEGVGQSTKFYSARIQLTDSGVFEITKLEEISITDLSMIEAMPYYSFDTGLLELPVISSVDNTNQVLTYTAQLKYMSTDMGKVTFKLLYVKKLQ